LEQVDRQTHHLQGLVNDFLDLSILREERMPLRLARCDLTAKCREVIEKQQALSGRSIVLQAPSTPFILNADCERMGQVVINLVTNAEHAVRGRPSAVIELATEARQDWVRLTVEDSGPGVPPEVRGRIFDPFFTTKSPDEGSGLGLSICQRVVAEVGGRIWLEDSERLGGAKFVVELPAAPIRDNAIG